MTVAELIAKLQTMPQDVEVVYDLFSDVTELREDEVKLVTADSCEIAKRNGKFF